MDDLNNKLREILDDCAESYYPLHEYPDQPIYTDQNKVTLDRTVAQIHQAYKEAGYIHVNLGQETQAALANTMLGHKVMTGQDWEQKALKAGWTKPDDRN